MSRTRTVPGRRVADLDFALGPFSTLRSQGAGRACRRSERLSGPRPEVCRIVDLRADYPQSASVHVPLGECRLRVLPRAIPESISRDALVSRLRVLGVAMPATFLVSVLFGATLNAGFSWYIAYASIGTAVVIGLPIFIFELFYVYSPLGAGFRRWPFARFIAVRFALWWAWIIIATQLSSHWFSPTEGELFADADFWWIILFSFAVGFSVVSGLTLNRLIGPGVFRNFLLGRYHTPREEERALLFIDLVGSTAIAERIGATRFLELMNEFVYDVGAALEGSGGVIYQYVGDEAIITWRLGKTRDISGAVEVVFRLHARVAARGDVYRSRFGMVPAFRAALHAGPVVVGEIGDSKLEIVLLGDTVNTTSRIEQSCRKFDRDFLASAEALALMTLPPGAESEAMPPVALKGKSRQVRLFAISHALRRRRRSPPA